MKNSIEILKNTPLFSNIEDSEMLTMLSCLSARERKYDKEEYIFTAESNIAEVGIVLSGSVNVIKEDFWGRRAIIAQMYKGDMFGEAFSCAEVSKIPVSVVTAEKSEILFINYKRIVTTCSSACAYHTRLIHNMLKILANKNIMLTNKMEHMVKRTTRDKLLSYLSARAVAAKSNSFSIPFKRQELADYLSVDRSAMSNELSKMREEGILEFNKNQFKFLQ